MSKLVLFVFVACLLASVTLAFPGAETQAKQGRREDDEPENIACCSTELQPHECGRRNVCIVPVREPKGYSYQPCEPRPGLAADYCCGDADKSGQKYFDDSQQCCVDPTAPYSVCPLTAITFTLPGYTNTAKGNLWVLVDSVNAVDAWWVNGVAFSVPETNSLDWVMVPGVVVDESLTVNFQARSLGSRVSAIYYGTANPDTQRLRRRDCEDIDDCFTEPCQNGGTCTDGDGTYTCACADGFYGDDCEEIDECFPEPCLNGGTCTDGDGSYTCTCVDGYTGDNCDVPPGGPCPWETCDSETQNLVFRFPELGITTYEILDGQRVFYQDIDPEGLNSIVDRNGFVLVAPSSIRATTCAEANAGLGDIWVTSSDCVLISVDDVDAVWDLCRLDCVLPGGGAVDPAPPTSPVSVDGKPNSSP